MPIPSPDPFPHLVLDGDLQFALMCAEARREFNAVPADAWRWFDNEHERKAQAPFSAGGPTIAKLAAGLAKPEWCAEVAAWFGMPPLTFDELGGGLHRILPGGKLDIHVDFNRHPDGRYRRVNLLLYLNTYPDRSADLILATGEHSHAGTDVRIAATMGRMVLFATSETSWHGHPEPLRGDRERRSLAAYYYTTEPPDYDAPAHSTIFGGR